MNVPQQRLMGRDRFFRMASGLLFLSGCFVAFGLGRVLASPPGFLGAFIWMGFLARALLPLPSVAKRRVWWLISTLWHTGMVLISVMVVRSVGTPVVFYLLHSTLALGISLSGLCYDREPARRW